MVKGFVMMLIGVLVVSIASPAFTQEKAQAPAEEEAMPTDEVEYGYGAVVAIDEAKREMTVTEYDWETDAEVQVTYSIDPNVELENVAAVKEITPGVEAEIEYVIGPDGKKIAKYIGIYKIEEEAGAAPLEE